MDGRALFATERAARGGNGGDDGVRMTEEEYAAWMRRRAAEQAMRAKLCPSADDVADAAVGAVLDAPRRDAADGATEDAERRDGRSTAAGRGYGAVRGAKGSVPDGDDGQGKEGQRKRSKYGNLRVEVDGLRFDSKHEAQVYEELMLRVHAGELRTVCRQVKFDLPGRIVYIADFVTIGKDFTVDVYDAKSPATKKNRVYINKKKQMKALWGIDIKEI